MEQIQEIKNKKMESSASDKNTQENKMRKIKIEKVVLNIGGTEDKLERGHKLLEILTNRKPVKVKATRRIPSWNVRPGLAVGTKVTLRGKEAKDILERILQAIDNTLKEKQIQNNFFSFGIEEYIEIPGIEYIREVGVLGFEVSVVFSRAGKRSEKKKIKRGKTRRLTIGKEEIMKFMEDNYQTKILRKRR